MPAQPTIHTRSTLLVAIVTSALTAAVVASLSARPAALAYALPDAALPALPSAANSAADSPIVGMFCEPSMRMTVPRDSTMLHADRKVPCDAQVIGWTTKGIFRVRANGTVEMLAVPMPPCADGDFYVWLAYPN